ncbi:bifunctional [glutamate--ammonia ligase]-adenylyl-L-tyrosine phosphorylase/[glutamate--ammonia-ligase] adenylyltransferase [Chromatium okenii]|uniref:bifunctional [glutamate--ammonia ligase]-adenylyl-L-tyrosine phosphorylase/[glutamate--ammonia-ligase] adenylyltransferase n=1 Tax=Chromatium okenii TaxID=61644 RepID=UPI00322190E0
MCGVVKSQLFDKSPNPPFPKGGFSSSPLRKRGAGGDLAQRLAVALTGITDDTALQRALRQFRRREMVRIIWRDLAGWAELPETLEDLSELADVCIQQTLDLLHIWTCAELGTPRAADGRELHLIVLAMGKLGARELNLSSDIDLIFAFAQSGEIRDVPRPLTHEQFFVRLARRLVQTLANQTADGFVFRVDTRLRPFGEVGPLAMNFQALEDYYQSQAREWERYAMIKARPVAGDPADSAQLMALLRPFVYRRYLDFGAFESLRDLKRMIAKELYRRGMDANIKLGPGGIREIEFIGQAFQLVRGGRDPELQVRPIRQVLALLAAKQLMPAEAVAQLDAAYEFLRLVENRLQAHRDKQTHILPDDEIGRERLARSMGFADWATFAPVLDAHRRVVQQQFDEVFAAPDAAEAIDGEANLQLLWSGTQETASDVTALAQAGFADPAAVQTCIAQFRDATDRKGLSSKGRERLAQVMPTVLRISAACEQPTLALTRVLRLLETIVQRTAYLAMLIESPGILAQLCRLAGMSPWFTEQIGRQPLLLDELIDPRRLYAPLRREDLETELDALLLPVDAADLEQQMERLHQFVQGNVLRVAAADVTEVIPLMIVSDYLTEIAEVALARVLQLTFEHLVRQHGRPTAINGANSGFLVLGYGKLGGIELGYGSDLDLVFVHGSDDVMAMTDSAKPVSNVQFYARLGQRMIHMLTTRTLSGALYDVDMRLRPDGNKGMLVRSLTAFAAYQETDAWTWEHQALVRARPVAGDPVLAQQFEAVRRAVLCRQRDPAQLQREVREMREKMRVNLDKTTAHRFDLKQGVGGIADIEFMVQYAVLRWAAEHSALVEWTDNIRLLDTLARLGLLPGHTAQMLTDAYKTLRAIYHRNALTQQPQTIAADQLLVEREQVRMLWQVLLDSNH